MALHFRFAGNGKTVWTYWKNTGDGSTKWLEVIDLPFILQPSASPSEVVFEVLPFQTPSVKVPVTTAGVPDPTNAQYPNVYVTRFDFPGSANTETELTVGATSVPTGEAVGARIAVTLNPSVETAWAMHRLRFEVWDNGGTKFDWEIYYYRRNKGPAVSFTHSAAHEEEGAASDNREDDNDD